MSNKKVLIIQDLACFGNSGLHVTESTLVSFGFEVAILPLKLKSTNNTFSNYTNISLIDEANKIIHHFIEEHIKFDLILASNIRKKEEFDIVKKCNDYLKEDNGILVVNPDFSENGKLYEGLDEDVIVKMMDLASISNYFITNISCAALMTRNDFIEIQDDSYINNLLSSLVEMGVKNVILTSVMDDEYSIGVIAYDGLTKTTIIKEKEDNYYPGIKDIFTSSFLGYVLQERTLKESIDHATDFVLDSIYNTYNDNNHNYGIKYEDLLKLYIDKKDPRY